MFNYMAFLLCRQFRTSYLLLKYFSDCPQTVCYISMLFLTNWEHQSKRVSTDKPFTSQSVLIAILRLSSLSICPAYFACVIQHYHGHRNVGESANYAVRAQVCWFVSLLSEVGRTKMPVLISKTDTQLSLHKRGPTKEPQQAWECQESDWVTHCDPLGYWK